MEPNNTQEINTSPIQQPAASPMMQPAAPPEPSPLQTQMPSPKTGSKKVIILLALLILLAVGAIVYILFAKSQLNKTQKTTTENSSLVLPSPTTMIPTVAPLEDLEISSPEADLLEIDDDIKGL